VTAGVFDLTEQYAIDAGAGYYVTFTYCNPVPGHPGVPGTPIVVTGWTAKMTIRSSYGDGAALTLTDTAGITVGTTDGTFAVALTATQTSQLPSQGVYDLLVTAPAAEPIRLVRGAVRCRQAVTR
jgi:hypothetical protein